MNDKHTHITNMLEQSSPKLPSQTKEVLWSKIESNLSTPVAVPSPYQFNFIPTRFLAPVALSLILVLGVGGMGTVAAAEQSKPGDLLYPLERAVEDLQLLLASDERSAELQAEFARKRLLELRAIIDEELAALGGTSATSSAQSASSTNTVDISASENTRINFAVSEFVRQLDDIENEDARKAVLSLIAETDGIDVGEDDDVRVRVEDDRVEFRFEDDETGERIRIREKDGEVRVEVKSDDDNKDDDNRNEDSSDDDNRPTTSRIIDEAEADAFAGTTTVKVELWNGADINFTTSATTRAGVVAEIVARTGAPTAEVDAVLDFEIEDRSSRSDDRDDSNGDDSEDDNSREDDSRDSDQSSDDEDDNPRDSNDDEDNRSDDSNDDSESEPRSTDDSEERVQIEVRVKDNRAEVRVEQGSEQDEFTLNYSDRATLIANIATQTGIPVATVSSALDLEIDD